VRTLVIQSYRTENVPRWIRRCLDSVEAWAASQKFDYLLADDSSFALCGADYLKRVGRNMRSITNLSRLELVRDAHQRGYDRAIWLDADVLVFHPELFTIDVVERYAFAREVWISRDREGRSHATPGVNNCAFVCIRGEPDLDFLIQATRHVAMHRPISSNYQVGGDLIKGLRNSLAFATLDDVGMFSPFVVKALADDDEELVARQAIEHGTPVFAANLCGASNYETTLSEPLTERAIDRLLATKGDIVNRWLLHSPNNLLTGQPHVGMGKLFPQAVNVALQFKQAQAYLPNLAAPRTFNERVAARKLSASGDLYRTTTDKYAVRQFVAERLGEEVLIPLLQVCERAEDLDFDALPSAFILKSAHASGWNEVVRDKSAADRDALRAKMRKWLRSNFYAAYFEPQYKDMSARIVAEPLLLTAEGIVPPDYRFYVFRGRVRVIGANTGLHRTDVCYSLFDPVWRRLIVEAAYPSAGELAPPRRLAEMIGAAEVLARDFDFARVDLYCFDDKVLFGEITHTPSGSLAKFTPADFDLALGQIWESGGPIPEKYYALDAAAGFRTDAGKQNPASGPLAAPAAEPAPVVRNIVAAPLSHLDRRLTDFNAFSNFRLTVKAFVSNPAQSGPIDLSIELGSDPKAHRAPFVSCLMVTRDRLRQAQFAVASYRQQTWKRRELIIVDTSEDDGLARWAASLNDPTIRFVFMPGCKDTLGEMRNLSVREAAGTHVCQWDDDDLSHPARLEAQIAALNATKTQACLLSREMMWMPGKFRLAILGRRAHENTFLCEKAVLPAYPGLARGEDTPAVEALLRWQTVVHLDQPELYLYIVHGANSWDDGHMEALWSNASHRFTMHAYDSALAQLSRCYPINDYRRFFQGPPIVSGPRKIVG